MGRHGIGAIARRRLAFGAGLVGLGLAFLWLLRGAGVGPDRAASPTVGQTAHPPPGLVTEGLHLVGRRLGQRQWEADAQRILQPLQGQALRFEGVRNGVFYRDGQVFLRFEGEGGLFEEPTARLRLEGEFRLQYRDTYRLQARDLVWDGQSQKLVTDRPVRVQGPDLVLDAGSMGLDVKAGVAHLADGVQLQQGVPGKGRVLAVQAPAADWFLETGEVVLYGPARAQQMGGDGH